MYGVIRSMSENWSREEVEATVEDYFKMLAKELRGERFNKAACNRTLQSLLPNRSKGAIELKHQNISAILIEIGYPYIDGYKPRRNYQHLLRSVVEERLSAAESLRAAVACAVIAPAELRLPIKNLLSIEVPPPMRDSEERRVYETAGRIPAVSRNYLEIEARNHSLGRAGEKLILHFERERLCRAGQMKLADRVEHVSNSEGDHLGYDIHSFEMDGQDRLIEVKTTRFGSMTPFFASRNEVKVSEANERCYHVYRVFQFSKQPRLFLLSGAIRKTCELDPVCFSALPNLSQ
jgi:hypothetical protein